MFIIKKKETVEVVKETFTVTISKKQFHKQKDLKKFMEETLDETELDIVDIIYKNDKVKIVAERISEV